MKITHKTTILLENEQERGYLKQMLCISEEIANQAVRVNALSPDLVRAGLDTLREAGDLAEFARMFKDEL